MLFVMALLVPSHAVSGAPPAATQPLFQRVAPTDCLLYYSWTAAVGADKQSQNRFQQFLAEPQVQHLTKQLWLGLQGVLERVAATDKTLGVEPLTQLVWQSSESLLNNPGAVYVWGEPLREGPAGLRAALLLRTGDKGDELSNLLVALMDVVNHERVVAEEILGAKSHRVELAEGRPPLVWARKDEYLLLAYGLDSLKELLSNWERAEPPTWLAEMRQALPVQQPAMMAYINFHSTRDFVTALLPDPDAVQAALAVIGLSNARSLEHVSGADGADWHSHTRLTLDGPPTGILKALASNGLTPADLQGLPADPLISIAWKTDPDQLFQSVMAAVRAVDGQTADEIEELVSAAEAELQIKLREDLLQSLGDGWALYCGSRGNLLGGWVARVKVKDRAGPDKLIQWFLSMLADAERAGEPRIPRIHQQPLPDGTLYVLDVPDNDFFVLPCLALTDDELVIGLFPQAVREHLQRDRTQPGWSDQDQLKEIFRKDRQTLAVVTTDNRRLFEFAYPLIQSGLHAFAAELKARVPLDASLLPAAPVLARHLTQDRLVVYFAADGLHLEQRGDLPLSAVGTAALVAAGLPWVTIRPAKVDLRSLEGGFFNVPVRPFRRKGN